jgi:hypothetical protein
MPGVGVSGPTLPAPQTVGLYLGYGLNENLAIEGFIGTGIGGSDVLLNGATSPTLSLNTIDENSAGDYFVKVYGTCDTAVSSTAHITVNNPVLITLQPVAAKICTSDSISLKVDASGTNNMYQWYTSLSFSVRGRYNTRR